MTGFEENAPWNVVRFGGFALDRSNRVLRQGGRIVPLGSRTLALLITLVDNAGSTVGKRDLMRTIWPDTSVDDSTLRFHVAALRRTLGDGDGARRIVTVLGRGYRFVESVSLAGPSPTKPDGGTGPRHSLPGRPARLIGRETAIQTLTARLLAHRFVTVVGSGGIGKTTLATALAHELLTEFSGEICFVDLGSVGDPALAADAVAAALGIAVRMADAGAGIIAFLRDQRKLLILDSCEHVIEAVGALAEQLCLCAPDIHLLATSREPLRVEAEWVYRIAPLDAPPAQDGISIAEVMAFPAVQLFLERMAAGGDALDLAMDDAAVIAGICRSLDGIPLAIELAASRADVLGLTETARLLHGRFPLAWRGRRTAPPRHQTLAATLDWSHGLLTDVERLLLRRLAILVGPFGLAAACAICGDETLAARAVLGALAGLVDKSLLVMIPAASASYRLLDTTRAYALDKLTASGELGSAARRHATHLRDRLENETAGSTPAETEGALTRDDLGNIRAALDWCFGDAGDIGLGVDLAAAASPLFLRLSLLTECNRWTERALSVLPEASRGTRQEMALHASLAVSSMFTMGNREQVRTSFERSLMIAERLGDLEQQVRLLASLNILHLRKGQHRSALAYAQRSAAAALQYGDLDAIAATEGLLGANYNLLGRQTEALALLTASVSRGMPSRSPVQLGFSTRNHAMISLALTLWIVGRSDQALAAARNTVAEAVQLGHPGTVCVALLYAISVFLWVGDLDRAETHLEQFITEAKRHSLSPYLAAGAGIKAEIAIRRGRAESGITVLRASLELLKREAYQMRLTAFSCAIAEGLMSLGRLNEAREAIDEAIDRGECDGDLVAMPEMLRIKGEITVCRQDATQDGEALMLRSLELARTQHALSWELRSAMSLARLWSGKGRNRDALLLLTSVYGRFEEGFSSTDLETARLLLAEMNESRTASSAHAGSR